MTTATIETERPRANRTRGAAVEPAQPARRDARRRPGTVLFAVPFAAAMNDADLARLARALDLSTHTHQKMRPDPTSPGVARLDHYSGLFLERGSSEGQWLLEARTWGRPAAETVAQWRRIAMLAAHQLDPTLAIVRPAPTRRGEQLAADRARARLVHRIHRELGRRT